MATLDKNPDPLRVLLVEDSFESLNLTKGMLLDFGITQVYTAKDGAEALDLIGMFDDEEDFIDLVLCDWNMPRMSGMELLKQIRSAGQEMLFIMLTGRADYTSVAEARAYGITGYIKKPFSSDQLRKKLNVASRVISHRKLEKID